MALRMVIDIICIRQFIHSIANNLITPSALFPIRQASRGIVSSNPTSMQITIDVSAIPIWVSQSWISAVFTTNEGSFNEVLLHPRLDYLALEDNSRLTIYLTLSLLPQ